MAWESLHGGPSEKMMDLKMFEIPEEQDIYQGEFLRITDNIYKLFCPQPKLEMEELLDKSFNDIHGVVEFGVRTVYANHVNLVLLFSSIFSLLDTIQCLQNGSAENNVPKQSIFLGKT